MSRVNEIMTECMKLREETFEVARAALSRAGTRHIPRTNDVVDFVVEARLAVLENMMAQVFSRETGPGTPEEKVMIALRDYWESVKESIVDAEKAEAPRA